MQISLIRFYADKAELNINSESGVKILKNNILIIVNPCSGKKRGRKSTDDIIHFLSDDSINITVKETACKGHAAQLAEQLGCEYDLIICCRGDGTFNEIINGVLCLDKKYRSHTYQTELQMIRQKPYLFLQSCLIWLK